MWAGVVAPSDEIGGRYCENCHVGQIVPDELPTSTMTEGVRGYALGYENRRSAVEEKRTTRRRVVLVNIWKKYDRCGFPVVAQLEFPGDESS